MNIWKHFDLLINTLSTAFIRQYLNCIQCLACSRQTDRQTRAAYWYGQIKTDGTAAPRSRYFQTSAGTDLPDWRDLNVLSCFLIQVESHSTCESFALLAKQSQRSHVLFCFVFVFPHWWTLGNDNGSSPPLPLLAPLFRNCVETAVSSALWDRLVLALVVDLQWGKSDIASHSAGSKSFLAAGCQTWG